MAKVLCFTRSKKQLAAFSHAVNTAGHSSVGCLSLEAAMRRVRTTPLAAIVAEHCGGGQKFRKFLAAAKLRKNIPVIIVAQHVVNAFQVAGSLGDLYLEEPSRHAELVNLIEILTSPAESQQQAAKPSAADSAAAMVHVGNRSVLKTEPEVAESAKPAAAAAH